MKNCDKFSDLWQMFAQIKEKCVVCFFCNATKTDALFLEEIVSKSEKALDKLQKIEIYKNNTKSIEHDKIVNFEKKKRNKIDEKIVDENDFSVAFQSAYLEPWNYKIYDDGDECEYVVNTQSASLLDWNMGRNPYSDLQRVSQKNSKDRSFSAAKIGKIFRCFLEMFEQYSEFEDIRARSKEILKMFEED